MKGTIEKRFMDFAVWLIAASVVAVILTSCSAAIPLPATATATASPGQATTTFEKIQKSPTPAPLHCTVTTGIDGGRVNLRTRPGTQYAVIRVLHEGEELTLIARASTNGRGAWLEVRDNEGNKGYVNSRYCKSNRARNTGT